jgi:hypothetical protein
MYSTRSWYKELGLELVSIEDKSYHMPKKPSMEGEIKDIGTSDPFKKILEEAFVQHNNDMVESF